MEKKQYLKQVFIDLVVKVDEIFRFGSWNTDGTSSVYKDLFRIKSFYFLFTYDRDGQERVRTLRQISKNDFFAEKQKLLSARPRIGCENWQDGVSAFELKRYQNYTWKKTLPADNCSFFKGIGQKENRLLSLYNQAVEAAAQSPKRQTPAVSKQHKENIKSALILSKALGVSYENVRAIGANSAILKEFKLSYEQAMCKVASLSPAERYEIYVSLKPSGGRHARKQAIADLGIHIFGADVKRLNLSELESLLSGLVQEYHRQSVKTAIANGIELPHDQREQIYNRMVSTTREEKRKVLTELGVDVKAIELNKYSLSPIKHAIAASIGIDMEEN